MLSFTIAHLSVIALRIKQPDARAALARAGRDQASAGTSCRCSRSSAGSAPGSRWIVVTVLNISTLVVGLVWLALGIATYVLYRRRQGLS